MPLNKLSRQPFNKLSATLAETHPDPSITLSQVINVLFDNIDHLSFLAHKRFRFSQSNSKDNLHLVISLHIETYFVRRILVNTGSSTNILDYETWRKMHLDDEHFQPHSVHLVNFLSITTHT